MTVIDSHVHYIDEDARDYIETLLLCMDEHNVDKSVLFGVQGDPMCSDAGVWHAVTAHPDRFIAFACSMRCDLKRDAEVFTNYAFKQPWKGVGEVFVDTAGAQAAAYVTRSGRQAHYPYYCPADKHHNPVYGEVFAQCGERGLPVMVHCMSTDTMAELLSLFPHTNFIWAHAEMCFSEHIVVPMLERYANLYCDIGVEFRLDSEKLFSEKIAPEDEWLPRAFAAWQSAASRHPSRIVWGSDVFQWPDLDPDAYARSREAFKRFCEPLSTEATAGIAGENLLSLLPREVL